MSTHHTPGDVSRDALLDVVASWAAAGAATQPKHATDVEEVIDATDAVRDQTPFLEDVGVLEAAGGGHQLTERGQALAGALTDGNDEQARERARVLLADWSVTGRVRGVVRGNPTEENELVRIAAAITGHDPDDSSVRSGVAALLALYDWAGLLERDDEGRYRLPEAGAASEAARGTAESAAEARCGISLAGPAESGGGETPASEPDHDADATESVSSEGAGDAERADGGSAPAESGE